MNAHAEHPARPGIGIDVVEIDALRRRLEDQPGLCEVLFTTGEQARAQAQPNPTAALALAFAAKEAFVKALQRGLTASGPDAWLRQVEVAPGPGGRPELLLGEAPRRALASRSLAAPLLALARDARHALATVLLVPAANVVKEGA